MFSTKKTFHFLKKRLAHIMGLLPELFDGLGIMNDAMVHLDIDPNVTSVVQPPRKVPQALVQPLKDEIDRML